MFCPMPNWTRTPGQTEHPEKIGPPPRGSRPVVTGSLQAMMIGPTLAEEISLPVYRSLGPFAAPSDDELPFTVGWGTNVHKQGLQISGVTFSYRDLSCSSQPAYPDVASYGSRFDLEALTGDWRLENFLRTFVDRQEGETAAEGEARVAEWWEVAESARNWRTVDVESTVLKLRRAH
jgi:hypothetical protein